MAYNQHKEEGANRCYGIPAILRLTSIQLRAIIESGGNMEVKLSRRAWLVLLALVASPATHAQAPPASPTPTIINVAYLAMARPSVVPESLLDPPPTDDGLQGARLAIVDNQTTGRFLRQDWRLQDTTVPDEAAALDAFRKLAAGGQRVVVADLPPDVLLKVADLPEAKDAVILDATSDDDRLRGPDCRRNVLHLLPSNAMLADALMQYLAVKDWRRLLLVTGPSEADHAYADAMRRAARKFQLRIVADKLWTFDPGARRTDTGHYAISAEAARFTQGVSYDVLVVADTTDDFGDDLAFRTTDPRPIAGTQGMVPTAWAPPFEEWGATQLQSRFLKQAHRFMTTRDFGAWMAVRAVGEATTHSGSTDPAKISTFLRSPDFELAAYKGARLTFRTWDGQLRQPVLLADSRSLISVSPQPGYLHEHNDLDTLGIDQPETTCHM
jgi:ABC transporter substrate binding protein (PQQ-dependent alcohol dehydrogenase system)